MASEWALRMREIQPGPGVFIIAGRTWSPKRWRPIRKRPHWDRVALKVARKRSRAAKRAQRARARA